MLPRAWGVQPPTLYIDRNLQQLLAAWGWEALPRMEEWDSESGPQIWHQPCQEFSLVNRKQGTHFLLFWWWLIQRTIAQLLREELRLGIKAQRRGMLQNMLRFSFPLPGGSSPGKSPRPGILNQIDFAPQETFASVWNHFQLSHWREVGRYYWHLVDEAKDVVKHLTLHKSVPTKKN